MVKGLARPPLLEQFLKRLPHPSWGSKGGDHRPKALFI